MTIRDCLSGAALPFRFAYFSVSVLLLVMPFTDPKSEWVVSGFYIYSSLFSLCFVLYAPVMAFSFYFFIRAVFAFLKFRRLRDGLFYLLAFVFGAIALYGFNSWVFSEIY